MKKPLLIIIAGPNGSGKTSITNRVLKYDWLDKCIYINPDNIAQDKFGDWNSKEAVIKAANFAAQMRENCLLENKSFIFETVLSAGDKIDFIYQARQRGYFIRLFFVATNSPRINASRIARRVIEGGHDVPITKIISRYSKSIANFCIAAKLVDRAYLYDNSIELEEAKILFKISNGIITKIYNKINDWALPIISQINNDTNQA